MAVATEDAVWREYLVLFAHHCMYFNMRFQELEAVAGMLGVPRSALYVDSPAPTALDDTPLVLVRLPSDAAARMLVARAVLIKVALEVWAQGVTYEDAVAQGLAAGDRARAQRRVHLAPPHTFQLRIVAFGRTPTMDEKRDLMELLRPLFEGDEIADLHNPETTVWALAEYDHHTDAKTHLGPRNHQPRRTFVARQVAGGRSVDKKLKGGDKAFFQRYDLSQRAVLGPTTLENELAFIMANCAQVQPGHMALEPFCGTGGIMVALSHFGARVTGGEIDIRVVKGWRVAYTKNKAAQLEAAAHRGLASSSHAEVSGGLGSPRPAVPAAPRGAAAGSMPSRGGPLSLRHLVSIGLVPRAVLGLSGTPDAAASTQDGARSSGGPAKAAARASGGQRDIFTNFLQYALPSPEVVVCDNASRPWRIVDAGWLDCIVTDPPYGVRAASKKQGREPGSRVVEILDRSNYIPPKVSYDEDALMSDLLSLAAEALRGGGRLVFLAPVDLADFLGIDRAASERGGGPRGSLHNTAMPKGGRTKDPRLCISETSRDPLLLDETRYTDFIPSHAQLELVGASLQILSGGLGRLLVTMSRKPRCQTR